MSLPVLAPVAEMAEQLERPGTGARGMVRALEVLGQALEADRVLAFEHGLGALPSRRAAELRYGWSARPLGKVAQQGFPLRDYAPEWVGELVRGRAAWQRVEEATLPLRLLLGGQQVKSVLVLPLTVGEGSSQWWGFLRVDDCRQARSWSSRQQAVALQLARALSGALGRNPLLRAEVQVPAWLAPREGLQAAA